MRGSIVYEGTNLFMQPAFGVCDTGTDNIATWDLSRRWPPSQTPLLVCLSCFPLVALLSSLGCPLGSASSEPVAPAPRVASRSSHPTVVKHLTNLMAAIVPDLKGNTSNAATGYVAPCNVPGGSCYADDAAAAGVLKSNNAWYPWKTLAAIST